MMKKYKVEVDKKPGLKTGVAIIGKRFIVLLACKSCGQLHTHLKSSSTISCRMAFLSFAMSLAFAARLAATSSRAALALASASL